MTTNNLNENNTVLKEKFDCFWQQMVRLANEYWNMYDEAFPETNQNYHKNEMEEYNEKDIPF